MISYKHLYDYYISDQNVIDACMNATKGKVKHKFLCDVRSNVYLYEPKVKHWAIYFYNSFHKPIQIYDGITRKKREIVVPSDIEQLVHHMIVQTIKPMCLHGMYEHAYGSVPNRGTEKCEHYIEQAIKYHPKECKYCLKTDIHHYFPSIDRKIMKAKFRKKINDDKFNALIGVILEYDKLGELLKLSKVKGVYDLCSYGKPTDLWYLFQEYVGTDDTENIRKTICSLSCPVSAKDELLTIALSERKGIPLGFYTSQWFSQFYLEDFDHYIKEKLGADFYFRYVDDQVIFGSNKKKLHKIQKAMAQYMHDELNLEMKPNWQVFRFDHIGKDGIHYGRDLDFLGYRFYCDRTVLRRNIMMKATRKANRMWKKRSFSAYDSRQLLSYLGRIDHSDTYDMYTEWIKPIVSIQQCKRKVRAYDKARKRGEECTQSEATPDPKQQTQQVLPFTITTEPM